MGISSNQARFLALTSRQVDLESRIQQICQRRLRLSSELENVATSYNNQISNRRLYTMNTSNSGITALSIPTITGIKDNNGKDYHVLGYNTGTGAYVGIPDAATVKALPGYANLGLPATATDEEVFDAALRSNFITIAMQADEFTQVSYHVGSYDYELKDWRTLPAFADELYNGDDVDAENKYDKTVAEINSQDKKLQLEQTSIEVEYKAVSSERESVKKILDNNAQSSFKYFS